MSRPTNPNACAVLFMNTETRDFVFRWGFIPDYRYLDLAAEAIVQSAYDELEFLQSEFEGLSAFQSGDNGETWKKVVYQFEYNEDFPEVLTVSCDKGMPSVTYLALITDKDKNLAGMIAENMDRVPLTNESGVFSVDGNVYLNETRVDLDGVMGKVN